ncbi:MAG: hypothetical protein VKJ66_01615 [Synechococcus sp.]|nr:hypothetical protein [Synechococcus sp.]
MWLPALLALLVGLAGCSEEPLPERTIRADDCLRDVQIKQLKASIRRCDAVVKAFPSDPAPLNDRFLLHSLNGDGPAACRDIRRAVALAARQPAASLDPLLKEDLRLRAASCAG